MKKKLWGGRFSKKTAPLVEEFTRSIQYDHKLWLCDLYGSIIHVNVLRRSGLISKTEAVRLEAALRSIAATGGYRYDPSAEDVHTNIQNLLLKKAGDLALKLHTARSRNDQVAFTTRLYCSVELEGIIKRIDSFIAVLAGVADAHKGLVIPGFTHMQHAQPVYLKDHLLAYAEMLGRDKARFKFIRSNLVLTMGAGALAGTPIKWSSYAGVKVGPLGPFGNITLSPTGNSLDAVSDRDFIVEIISALSLVATHLSRLAEDLILWSTKEFSFVELDDAYCTGSSLMPQKKNADVLELVRGYAGRLTGNLVSVLVMMKGLPLSYNRDMQLDKEPLFNSLETVLRELAVLEGLVKTMTFNEEAIDKHLDDESLYMTDIVYYLVALGVAFSTAHSLVGELVKHSAKHALPIRSMPESLLKELLGPKVKRGDIIKLFDPKVSVASKVSIRRRS